MTLFGEDQGTTAKREDSRIDAKSFEIPKRLIWEAWKRVAVNQGGPGVDRESIELFRNRLGRNLYALWNRMSPGSYFPQPVREVLIPKGDGQFRPLGIPTVTDLEIRGEASLDKNGRESYKKGSLRIDVAVYSGGKPIVIMDMKLGAKGNGNRISNKKWFEYERRFGAVLATIGIQI